MPRSLFITDLNLCPPMQDLYQEIDDRTVLFVTCLARSGAEVSVIAIVGCDQCNTFDSKKSRSCALNSTISQGLNIVYLRPDETNRNQHITVYIENFNVTSSQNVSIQCIVRRDSFSSEDSVLERFNWTVRYGIKLLYCKFQAHACMY